MIKQKVSVIGCDLYPAINEKLKNGSLTVSLFQQQDILGEKTLLNLYDVLCGLIEENQCSENYVVCPVYRSMLDYYKIYL